MSLQALTNPSLFRLTFRMIPKEPQPGLAVSFPAITEKRFVCITYSLQHIVLVCLSQSNRHGGTELS